MVIGESDKDTKYNDGYFLKLCKCEESLVHGCTYTHKKTPAGRGVARFSSILLYADILHFELHGFSCRSKYLCHIAYFFA